MFEPRLNTILASMTESKSGMECYYEGKKISRSWNESHGDVARLLAWLSGYGLQPGDRVGIQAMNSYEWVIIDLACLAGGFISLAFDPEVKEDPQALVKTYRLKALFSSLAPTNTVFPLLRPEQFMERLPAGAPAFTPHTFGPEDIVAFKFTSGSTSSPKMLGVMQQSVSAALGAVQEMFHHGEGDRMLVFLGLHTYQQRYWVYSSILYDYTLVLVPKQFVFHSLCSDRITVVMGVPHFYETFIKLFQVECEETEREERRPADPDEVYRKLTGGTLRYLWTGSAPISRETLEFYLRRGTPLYQGYGMNETCIVSKNYPGGNKTGSTGKLCPHQEVRFDEGGQMLVKNHYPVNRAYTICNPGDNERTFLPGGYVATGDLGYIDDEGYLYVTGRRKELIVLANARKVHPHIIEKAVEASPLVAQCMVFGDAKPYLVALVVPQAPSTREKPIREAIDHCLREFPEEEKIARFLLLKEPFSVENGQLSAQKKLQRKAIMDKYLKEISNLYH